MAVRRRLSRTEPEPLPPMRWGRFALGLVGIAVGVFVIWLGVRGL